MQKRCQSRPTSSNDSDATDKPSPLNTDGEASTPVVPKGATASATDDSDDDTDPEDDTDDEVSSEDEFDDYFPCSKLLITRMEVHWQRKKEKPSADPKWRSPVDTLRAAGRRNLYLFFNWCFKLTSGKGGRRLKGTTKSSSLRGDWKNFLRYYEGATDTKMDPRLMRLMRKSLRRLVKKRGLDMQEKTPVYVKDMASLQETILRTQEKRFWLRLQQMQICLYNLDLRVSLQRDSSGEPNLPTVEFSYKFTTKKHLGLTQTHVLSALIPGHTPWLTSDQEHVHSARDHLRPVG
ncbi:hypothetical protein PAAG_11667 [Paracoccidioides lutzii Pb01]|uniref:Uncharacterized protein n=1 Tax=Paracoccidioides lutzii (strain ATCC MYA-826 / Pb01) TaxID=502779 RepID=A0A0A2VLG8_PARBA|nr:hypothetical protein PAAG_11667 [Paracoccidioides lutzii Pb01]KGQ01674.1 hypothetical protein PAAG_11667 [Paracoccidioides lutzii Pb01]